MIVDIVIIVSFILVQIFIGSVIILYKLTSWLVGDNDIRELGIFVLLGSVLITFSVFSGIDHITTRSKEIGYNKGQIDMLKGNIHHTTVIDTTTNDTLFVKIIE